jgi:hypothetical protein
MPDVLVRIGTPTGLNKHNKQPPIINAKVFYLNAEISKKDVTKSN